MQHGRNHQGREEHVGTGRSRGTPDRGAEEAPLLAAGRKRGVPREGVVGAHRGRREATGAMLSSADRSEDAVRGGAEVAPTAQAVRDQQKRHTREGSLGRIVSRTPGKQAAGRKPRGG
jgi:hypothetical protein